MRPIELTLQAFGPYPEVEKIDFRHLSKGGLFLIHGQTGAGKTSILDGICFALFGTSSGDRKSEGLRCDLAAVSLKTEVMLEFALGNDHYRVMRQPKQQVKKKRGEGTATHGSYSELFKFDATLTWQPLSQGEAKTDEQILNLLGMNEDQFRQVVVLPQGKFRQFLAAGSSERETLLETLFRTDRYRTLSELLTVQAENLKSEVLNRRTQLESQRLLLELADGQSVELKLAQISASVELLLQRLPELEARYKSASDLAEQARRWQRLQSDREALDQRIVLLELREPEIRQSSLILEEEEKARPVLLIDQDLQRTESELHKQQANLLQAQSAASESRASLALALEKQRRVKEETAKLDSLKVQRENLRELWRDAEKLKKETDLASQTERKFAALETAIVASESDLARATQALRRLREEGDRLQQNQLLLERARHQLQLKKTELDDLIEQNHALQRSENELAVLQKQTAEAALRHAEIDRRSKELQRQNHLNQAAALARELQDEVACPVCGSRDHPRPAKFETGEAISVAELDLLANEVKKSGVLLSGVQLRAEMVRDSIAKIRLQLEAIVPLTSQSEPLDFRLQRRLTDLQEETHVLAGEIAERDRQNSTLTRQLIELRGSEESQKLLESNDKALRLAREGALVELQALRTRIVDLQERVPLDSRDLGELKTRGLHLAQLIERLETANIEADQAVNSSAQSEAAARATQTALALRTEELGKTSAEIRAARDLALKGSGFLSIELARSAGRRSEQIAELQERVRRFSEERAICKSHQVQNQNELDALSSRAFDLGNAESELLAIEQERNNVQGQLIEARHQLAQLEANARRFTQVEAELRSLEEKYKIRGRLAGVASGQLQFNSSRVAFSRYVLAARLDEVLDASTRRLDQMTRGQFRLKRATSQEDRRRSGGLDLEVEDAMSGTSRSTASLSGGEGFVASLCLALGLADVVQSRFGGIRLETVFVDEGFGTLDLESLDLALKTLAQLQAGGRMVGIISHVPELKEQIANRLWVRKGLAGSSATWEANASP